VTGRVRLVAALVVLLVVSPAYGVARFAYGQHEGHQRPAAPTAAQPGHQHEHRDEPAKPSTALPPFIPPVTDEDRKAAFPDVDGHAAHDGSLHSFVLIDRLEWQGGGRGDALSLDAQGWIGGDRDRLWVRAEGHREDGHVGAAEVRALYGRHILRWWDLVAGLRQDVRPGPAQTWAVVGIQGLAPYWFEVEATGSVGAGGRTQVRFEVEYDLLLTNRLVLQPLVELELNGKPDPERGIDAGLSRTEAGFRLRYELRREFAPYAGIVWKNASGEGERDGARFVTGLRVWF
jgi:copper resistance protein B